VRHLPHCFLAIREWDGLLTCLTDLDYLDARCRADEPNVLVRDYQEALALWPGQQQKANSEQNSILRLTEYGKKLSAHATDPKNNALPSPPTSVGMRPATWDTVSLGVEPSGAIEGMGAFRGGPSAMAWPGYPPIFQLAWNSAADGPIQVALEKKSKPQGSWLELLNSAGL